MSQDSIEVVRAAFDAFFRDDMDGILALCDEDIVITQAPEVPGVAPQQHGHAGVREAFALWPEQWDDFWLEVERMVEGPANQVVVTTRQGGRGKLSGVEVETEFAFVFEVRDGKIASWRIFVREEQALAAAGLAA